MDEMARRWPGRGPWDEVWFLEIDAGGGRTVWLRYVLGDGSHRRGLTTWAILFDGDGPQADQGRYHLSALRPDKPVAIGDDLFLDAPRRGVGRAAGRAGAAHWDLQLQVGPRHHRMVPSLVQRLQLGRTYVPAALDLTVQGHVDIGGRRLELSDAPAVLGHIWGATNRTSSWAWCHAHLAEHDLLFEGLTAKLGRLPWLTTFGLWIGERHIDLSGHRNLISTRSGVGRNSWSFEGARDGVRVRGEVHLPVAEQVATVRYLDPGDGRVRTCRNSGLSTLHLSVEEGGSRRRFSAPRAAFEIAQLGEPTTPVLLSD